MRQLVGKNIPEVDPYWVRIIVVIVAVAFVPSIFNFIKRN